MHLHRNEWDKNEGIKAVYILFFSSRFFALWKFIKYIHNIIQVYSVMSYNYMFLALYSLKSFFFSVLCLVDVFFSLLLFFFVLSFFCVHLTERLMNLFFINLNRFLDDAYLCWDCCYCCSLSSLDFDTLILSVHEIRISYTRS